MRNYSYENVFHLNVHFHANQSFSFEWFRTKTRFETEANGNSEMAYYWMRLRMKASIVRSEVHLPKAKQQKNESLELIISRSHENQIF